MPRQAKAVAKMEAVIPTRSLVASAVRYDGQTVPRIYQQRQEWQHECYRHYAICGEARFAARLFGHALSRVILYAAKPGKTGPVRLTSGATVELLSDLFSGADGQAQMLEAIGIHLTIAGECYLVGREINGEDAWEIVSVLEMNVQGDKWSIRYGDGMQDVTLDDSDVVIRIWNPSPGRRIEADSPFRSLLPILMEIEWLTRHVFAQISSRLASAGILLLPQGMSFPPPPEQNGKPVVPANEASAFMLTLAETMIASVKDPGDPAALVPIVVTAPDDTIDKAKLLTFWTDLDKEAKALRQEAIGRFASGMDLPREQIEGISGSEGTGGGRSNGVSHWGAWQIEESTIKMFVEPMAEQVTNALTVGYSRPLLDDPESVEFIYYDSSALRLRPDRSGEALELWDRGALATRTLLRENGFTDEDLPDEKEQELWLLRKVASGSATPEMVNAALEMLGVPLDVPELQGPMREARPDPSLEGHPPPQAPPEAAALLAASDALVFRALERAGNRIRQNEGIKPPGVPSYKMHTLVQVNGSAETLLDDAWSCAPQVLEGIADVDTTVQLLNAYCRSLFSEQAPHTRDRLKQWLEVAG